MQTTKRIKKSYSSFNQEDAEKYLNIKFGEIFNQQKPVETIIKFEAVNIELKEKIYNALVDYITVEDFPVGSLSYIKEASITDMVAFILVPIIAEFKKKEKRDKMKLRREKEVIGPDNVSGIEEFVIMDTIESDTETYIVIVEAKRADVDKAFTQCALALHDAYNMNNDNKSVYGFMTTGVSWKLIMYNGRFHMSEDFLAAFPLMKDDRERWFEDYSKIVDIIYYSLFH